MSSRSSLARCARWLSRLVPLTVLGATSIVGQTVQTLQSTQLVQLPDVNTLQPPPARIPIFYPPDPPAPGGIIDRVSLLQLPQWDAPVELAAFAGELFYPALATRLAENEMTRKLRERVQRYREQREKLAAELRTSLRSGEPFASTTALQALATEAEKLSDDLMVPDCHWNRYRQWSPMAKLDKEDQALLATRQFHFLRASIFYRDGLSTSQRRLLHDFVLWSARFATPATEVTMPPVSPGAVLSFFPMPSYIRLPDTLPRDVAGELQAVLRTRHELQKELVAALLDTDQLAWSERQRVLAALAGKQQPQIEAMEAAAEQVRLRLAALAEPALPPLPQPVVETGRAYMQARDALNQELAARLAAVRREHCRYRAGSETLVWKANFASGGYVSIDAFRTPQELSAVIDETYAQRARPAATAAALQKAQAAFQTEMAARQKEMESLRARYVAGALLVLFPQHPPDAPYPSEMVAYTVRRLQLEEVRERMAKQSDYLTATLRPGLPPDQRRLLLQQTLADMPLPLPPGIRRPAYRLDAP